MSENLPALTGFSSLAQGNSVEAKILDQFIADSNYTQVAKLLQSLSKQIQNEEPGFKIGQLCIGDEPYDITRDAPMNIVVIAQRFRGIRFENDKPVENVFDTSDPKYTEWMETKEPGKTAGVELLLWLPSLGIASRFLLAATALKNLSEFPCGVPLGLFAKKVKGKGWYYVPKAKRVDIDPTTLTQPDWEWMTSIRNKFLNPDGFEDLAGGRPDAAEAPAAEEQPKKSKKARKR